ncbi:hypothetical protein PVK06_004772 [Gossypium arboreum]|uniref:Reverse transcriptase domain-containing protein n=1 Tax=Gossypium arboreum TaxID=29729 RepID=A0ABR0QTU5_GOSAR|nr:hypothetical protein PVK06_004772 [Gossypium arboreum]
MGHQMQNWSKGRSKELKRNRFELEGKLIRLYSQDPSDEMLAKIMEVQVELNLEADKEELFCEQRARVNWLKKAYDVGLDEHLFNLVEKKVTDSINDTLLRHFTKEDIAYAIKMMAPLKAEVDVFPAIFFQRYWYIVGSEIARYCLSILNGQAEVEEINKTHIILIPKVDKPKNMLRFIPISLCNVVCKIIAKVLRAFIPGRLISDNMLIVYEVLHSLKMKKSGKKGNFTLKLDTSKAYDQVEWNFLAGMMKHLGFHEDWIVLIMRAMLRVRGLEWSKISFRGARVVQDIIREYEMVSRQRVNFDKSLIYFEANVNSNIWRILSQPRCLLARVLRARYFSFSDILSAKIGSYPSFTWRSICSARELIVEGILWQVGSGDRINIWNDLWLPGRENNRVTVQQIRPNWMNVNQLIDTESNT